MSVAINPNLEKALDLPVGTSGIYAIIHKHTGRAYVGSSTNVRGRVKGHRSSLNRGDHHCKFLQKLWSRGHERDFDFRLLSRDEPGKPLLQLEQAWMDKVNAKGLLINTYRTAHRPGVSKYYRVTDMPGWVLVASALFVTVAIGIQSFRSLGL